MGGGGSRAGGCKKLAFIEAWRGGGSMGGFRGGNGGIFASWGPGGRVLENTAAPGGADCGGASWEPRRFRKGLVGFGGREGGVGLAGAEAIEVGPLGVKGLLSEDGRRDRFPSGEGERDFSSSGCATTQMCQWDIIDA